MQLGKVVFNLFNKLGFVTIGKIMAFVSVPIISRALGPEQYGIYNYVLAIAGYAFLPANWGFLAKGVRDVARAKTEKWKVVAPIVSARVTLWWLGGVFWLGLSYIISRDSSLNLYIFLAILTNLGVAASIDFYFYGNKNTLIPSVSALISQVFFLLLVWLFVKSEEDLFKLMIFNILYRLLEAILMLFIFRQKYPFVISFASRNAIPILKKNFLLGLGAKAAFFQSSFPLIVIPVMLDNYQLGVFSATFKLFLILSLLVQSINLVFSPMIVESMGGAMSNRVLLFRKLFIGYSLIGICSALFLFFFGPLLIEILFGEEFNESQNLITTFSIILAPILPLQQLLSNYMNNFEQDRVFFIGALTQSIIILCLVPLFLYLFGLNGVVYGLGIANLIVLLYYRFKLNMKLGK